MIFKKEMFFLSLAGALFLLLFPTSSARAGEPLDILTASGKVINFDVEIAKTPESRRYGLMGRVKLDPDKGMLFLFDKVESPQFWMKDTRISLDIIYIGADGIIKGIHRNATPKNLTPIPAPEPILAVLEIRGMGAKVLGISKGDKVIHKFFEKDLK